MSIKFNRNGVDRKTSWDKLLSWTTSGFSFKIFFLGPGGKFNGPSIKFILREDTLIELEEILSESASPFITYLRSIRVLEDHFLVLYQFQVNFFYLYENFHLNMTLKVHIILHHYHDYFDWTGRTMRFTNGEFVESSHYSFKKEERTHGFQLKRAMQPSIYYKRKSWSTQKGCT